MNILFDMVSSQGIFNGGAEYTIRVFDALYAKMLSIDSKINIFCLYDYKLPSPYNIFSFDRILNNYPHVNIVFINDGDLTSIIQVKRIDTFFIGIGQRYLNIDLSKLQCKIVMVIHDALFSEDQDGHFTEYLNLYNSERINPIRKVVRKIKGNLFKQNSCDVEAFFKSIANSQNIQIITVSEFSKNSLIYYGGLRNIRVLYSPPKLYAVKEEIESQEMKKILMTIDKYLLIVSSNRILKNARKALEAVRRYRELYDMKMNVITIGNKEPLFEGHYCLPYLSPSDLEHAYKYCYALLYPSILEGFGYPPLEVMKYKRPVISSNVCSMPEILGDAPSYFSPFYVSDIVKAIKNVADNYELFVDKSAKQVRVVNDRQIADLEILISIILQ